ncbi:MAG: CBS domain protein AcuB, partial [uncultured Rubrobacteraceae bacterium]
GPRGGNALAGGDGGGGARPVPPETHPAFAGCGGRPPRWDRLGQGPALGDAGARGPGAGGGARGDPGRRSHGPGRGDRQARRPHRRRGERDEGEEDQLPPRPRGGRAGRHPHLLGRYGVPGLPARRARAGEPDGGRRTRPSGNSSGRGGPDRGARHKHRERRDGTPPGGLAPGPRRRLPRGHHKPRGGRRSAGEGRLPGALAAPAV